MKIPTKEEMFEAIPLEMFREIIKTAMREAWVLGNKWDAMSEKDRLAAEVQECAKTHARALAIHAVTGHSEDPDLRILFMMLQAVHNEGIGVIEREGEDFYKTEATVR